MISSASSESMSKSSGSEVRKIYCDIPGFSRYIAGSDGEVYSKNYNNRGVVKKLIGKIDKDGYCQLILYDDDGKRRYRRKHRLIAIAFIPNPDNLPQVNHKDGDKYNCTPLNLEWLTQSDNIQHGYNNKLYSRLTPIIAKNVETGDILEFDSIHQAGREMGINHQRIWDCISGRRRSYCGYTFSRKVVVSNEHQ